MTPLPRIRHHDTLGTAVEQSDGSWAVVPHVLRSAKYVLTAEWMVRNPGWRELRVVEEDDET